MRRNSEKMNNRIVGTSTQQLPMKNSKPCIFISRGKDSAIIVEQLKELLTGEQMQPIIPVECEAMAKPLPNKVIEDMRICNAGIIHIDVAELPVGNGEQKLEYLNENLLIGAAIALYGKRIILLCKQGTSLPWISEGLYRCEYEGERLDSASTMKLLKTIQEFREMT